MDRRHSIDRRIVDNLAFGWQQPGKHGAWSLRHIINMKSAAVSLNIAAYRIVVSHIDVLAEICNMRL